MTPVLLRRIVVAFCVAATSGLAACDSPVAPDRTLFVEVHELFVEGQGIIRPGRTIAVPPEGVSLRFRGLFGATGYPLEQTYVIVETLSSEGRAFGASSCCRGVHTNTSASTWEYSIRDWRPCSGNFCADAAALNVKLHHFPPGAFFSTVLLNEAQPWPIHFVVEGRESKVESRTAESKVAVVVAVESHESRRRETGRRESRAEGPSPRRRRLTTADHD